MRFAITFTALVVWNAFPATPPVRADAPATRDSSASRSRSRHMRQSTAIEVQNDRNVDVTVYAQGSTGEIRLGVVRADSIATLTIPEWLVLESGSIDIFVQPRGQFEEDTGPLEIREGDRIGVVVPQFPRPQWLMLDDR